VAAFISLTCNGLSFVRCSHLQHQQTDHELTIAAPPWGILYVFITGCRWQDLPRDYGAPTTVWRRLKRWGEESVWEHIWGTGLTALDQFSQLDWSIAFLEGSFVSAKKGGEKVGLTRKG
jgi:Putative transposase of IS4/5 family (DUF4096)